MGHTWAFIVLMNVAGIPKSSFQMRKRKFLPPRGNLPGVLYTTRDAAGKGPRSPDSQCRDLAHLVHLGNKYLLSTQCVPGTVLGITVLNVELLF